jgi:hypothetical protein
MGRPAVLAMIGAVLSGCTSSTAPADAGLGEAGSNDTGFFDGGSLEDARFDRGPFDAIVDGCGASDIAPSGAGSGKAGDAESNDATALCTAGANARLFVVTAILEGVSPRDGLFISDDGAVIAGSLTIGGGLVEAFRWTAPGGVKRLGFPNDHNMSQVVALSADGAVVAGTASSQAVGFQAFRWTECTGMTLLGPSNRSMATAVSADGAVVTGEFWATRQSPAPQSFRWTAATSTIALDPPAQFKGTRPLAVSADGSTIVGISEDVLVPQGFRWTAFGWSLFGPVARPSLVSADGSIVAGWSASDPSAIPGIAVRWSEPSGIETLGTLPDRSSSTPMAMSSDGAVIVGYAFKGLPSDPFQDNLAFRFTQETGLKVLERLPEPPVRYRLNQAMLVSADGATVIGFDSYLPEPPTGTAERRVVTWDALGIPQEIGFCLASADGGQVDVVPRTIEPLAISARGTHVVGRAQKRAADGGPGDSIAWVALLR